MYKPDLEGDNSYLLNYKIFTDYKRHLNFVYKNLISHKVKTGEISKTQGDIALGNFNSVDIDDFYLVSLRETLYREYTDEIIHHFGHFIPF